MRLARSLALGVVLLLFWGTGCRGGPATAAATPLSPTPWPTPRPYSSPTFTPPRPTVTFPAATPAAPTPTPIVHTVQEGDTFSGIALRYGVSVEALQKANPGLNPAALPIGAQVIVPQAGQALGLLATPTPYPARLAGPWCFPTASQAVCTLRVLNPGDQPLVGVQVLVEVQDPAWASAEPWRVVAQPWLLFVPPGDEVPLAVTVPRALGPQAATRALLLAALPASQAEAGVQPLPVRVSLDPAVEPPWPAQVQVALPADAEVRTVGVLVAAYDAAERVIALRYAEAPATAWAEGPRPVWLYPLTDARAARVAAWAEGYR